MVLRALALFFLIFLTQPCLAEVPGDPLSEFATAEQVAHRIHQYFAQSEYRKKADPKKPVVGDVLWGPEGYKKLLKRGAELCRTSGDIFAIASETGGRNDSNEALARVDFLSKTLPKTAEIPPTMKEVTALFTQLSKESQNIKEVMGAPRGTSEYTLRAEQTEKLKELAKTISFLQQKRLEEELKKESTVSGKVSELKKALAEGPARLLPFRTSHNGDLEDLGARFSATVSKVAEDLFKKAPDASSMAQFAEFLPKDSEILQESLPEFFAKNPTIEDVKSLIKLAKPSRQDHEDILRAAYADRNLSKAELDRLPRPAGFSLPFIGRASRLEAELKTICKSTAGGLVNAPRLGTVSSP